MIDESGLCVMPPKLIEALDTKSTEIQVVGLFKEVFKAVRRNV
jgi:hypothetical protein